MQKLFLFILLLAGTSHAEPSGKYLGAASCASSNCHGNINPQNTSNVLQNEYVTWFKHEAHAKAYTTLRNADSKKMAEHLGLPSAEKDPLCLSCHSTFAANDKRGPKFRLQDGVSCESCHGAAENWIKSHKEKGTTHAGNLANGMKDIVGYEKRAELCLSCHLGSDNQFVNHRLIGAGHPRLSFELDTFSLIQPNHWNVDEDYIKRKQDYVSAKAWAIGQAIRADKMLETLLSEKRSKFKNMPELSNFYCYSCHHSLNSDQWKQREYAGKPGELRINLSSLLIINRALQVIDRELADKLNTLLTKLADEFTTSDLAQLKELVTGPALDKLRATSFDKELSKQLLLQLVNYGIESQHLDYEVAEQVLMGISALVATISPEQALYKKEIDGLYEATGDEEEFDAEVFKQGLEKLKSSI